MKKKSKSRPSRRQAVNDKVLNANHPKIRPTITFAFKAAGVKYYHFTKDSETRYGRYIVLQAFLQEYYLRVDLKTLQANIRQLQKWLNPEIDKAGVGQLQLGKALELLSIMDQRANIAFEPETVYRLASCLFFDEHEILSAYDKVHNDKKITSWKEAGTVDFFFNELFKELTLLTVTSKEDLKAYLQKVPELLKGWRTMEDILSR